MIPFLVAAGTLLLGIALHAVIIAPRQLEVTELDVAIAGLGKAFHGYTIAVLSDIHYWQATDALRFSRIVAAVNAAQVDLVVLLGDYSRSFERLPRLSAAIYEEALAGLGASLSECQAVDGLVGVLGNHDHYYDGHRVAEWLASLGVRVLTNDHTVIKRGGASLVVSGVGDAAEDFVDPMGGMTNAPVDAPSILLSHSPDAVFRLDPDFRPGLILSGHTHGGQVVLPWFGAPITRARLCSRKTPSGWVPNRIGPLYITRGIGAQIPLRFLCPPEFLIVRLVQHHQHPA